MSILLDAFHFRFLCFDCYETFRFFSFAMPNIRFLISFVIPFLFPHHPFQSTVSTARYQGKVNRDLMFLLFNIFQSEEFCARLSVEMYDVVKFLQSVREFANHNLKRLVVVICVKHQGKIASSRSWLSLQWLCRHLRFQYAAASFSAVGINGG